MSEINNSIETVLSKLESFVSSKTVVGEPITIGKVIIVPLIDVSFGMGASADNSKGTKAARSEKDVSVAGLGAKMSPSAMLVINGSNVQMISTNDKSSLNKLIDMVPGIIDKTAGFFNDAAEVVDYDEVES